MKVSDLLGILDTIAPFCLAEPWDHCGLRLGSPDSKIHSIAVALDPLPSTMEMAAQRGCDFLLTHHPLIFNPLEDLVLKGLTEKAVASALRLGLSVASCHTCWDSSSDGVNAVLADLAGVKKWRPIIPSETIEGCGLGAVGDLPREMSPLEAGEYLAKCWNLSGFRLLEASSAKVSCLGLCGGAGGDLWSPAFQAGAQLYATADLRYHECQEMLDRDLSLMICDHGEMESPSMARLAEKLAAKCDLPVILLPPQPLPSKWSQN